MFLFVCPSVCLFACVAYRTCMLSIYRCCVLLCFVLQLVVLVVSAAAAAVDIYYVQCWRGWYMFLLLFVAGCFV